MTEVLTSVREAIVETAGSSLFGLYVYGSFVTGDFDPAISDLDLIAVLSADPDDELVRALGAMHEGLARTYPQWDDRIEVVYVAAHRLRDCRSGIPRMAVIGPGEPFHVVSGGPEWLLTWYPAREDGVALIGPPISDSIPDIDVGEFLAQVQERLRGFRGTLGNDATRGACAYAVMTVCRGMHALALGTRVPKLRACAWAMEEFPQWRKVIGSAITWREEQWVNNPTDSAAVQATRSFVQDMVERLDMDARLEDSGDSMTEDTVLVDFGWGPRWQELFEPYAGGDRIPARVVRSDRGSSLVATVEGVIRAKPSARLMKATGESVELPVVGDWVAVLASKDLDVPIIEAVLERQSAIVRGDSGRTSVRQALAANIDTVFVVHPIVDPPNLRRIERELSLAWESNATPVVVLSKMDLSPDPDEALVAVQSTALGADVILVNAFDGESVGQLLPYVSNRRTAVLIGPSGAGKSTLTNALLGQQRQATGDVRQTDGRGRHTTVARELIALPGGGSLIDTPGLRAIGLTGSETGVLSTFADIEELSSACHFSDCRHLDEPKCAVRAAADSGDLPAERLASYHKLLREAEVAAMKTDAHLRAKEKQKWKTISKAAREFKKRSGRE